MEDFYVLIPLKVPGMQYHVRPFTEVGSTQSFEANKNLSFKPSKAATNTFFFSKFELRQSIR